MTADDLLARIDSATEQWDTWDGRSADAARWWPDGTTPPALTLDVWRDHLHVAFASAIDAIRPACEAICPVVDAEIQQQESQQQAKHQPPMWAVQPNRERRR